jgi:molybdenum cofactor synthesis domain-containing protein
VRARPDARVSAPSRFAVLTVSDGVAAGTRTDASGAAIVAWIHARGSTAVHEIVPDASERIAGMLISMADGGDVDVIITTGGTGLTARDVTPEATRAVIEREVPGLAERLRAAGLASTPQAVLSRGMAGVRGRTLTAGPSRPWTWGIAELFKVESGQIRHIEAILHEVPYGMNAGWSTWEQGMSDALQDRTGI